MGNRIGRGFHRLAIFLAVVIFLSGSGWGVVVAIARADDAQRAHNEHVALVCAKEAIYENFYADFSREDFERRLADGAKEPTLDDLAPKHDLESLGCAEQPRKVSTNAIATASPTSNFSYAAALFPILGGFVGVSFALALVLYAFVRTIGWVVGGFFS